MPPRVPKIQRSKSGLHSTKGDLFSRSKPIASLAVLPVQVSDHWYHLKREEDPLTSAERAVLSFGALYCEDALSRADYYSRL